MALDSTAEGIRPQIGGQEKPKAAPKAEPISQPTPAEAQQPGILKRWLSRLGKKQATESVPHQLTQQDQEELDKAQTLLKSAALKGTARNFAVPESQSELATLDKIASLTDLTPEQIHRKAQLLAERESPSAVMTSRVAEIENELKAEQDRAMLKSFPTKTSTDNRQSNDSRFELKRLEALSSHSELTPDELHQKAVLTAQSELQGTRQSLTEAHVTEVEQRLKAEVEAKKAQAAPPEPVGAGSKS